MERKALLKFCGLYCKMAQDEEWAPVEDEELIPHSILDKKKISSLANKLFLKYAQDVINREEKHAKLFGKFDKLLLKRNDTWEVAYADYNQERYQRF